MKKFWNKYKGLVLVLIALIAFVLLSFLGEGKEEVIETPAADITSWQEGVNKDEYALTIIALSYCGACQNYQPVITRIASENNIPLFWFEIDELAEADATALTNTYDFSEYTGTSPYTAITKNGEVIAQTVGYASEEGTMEFLRTNGLVD